MNSERLGEDAAPSLHLSATDLANHLGCTHLTGLERARAHGRIDAPEWLDPSLAVLRERGLEHEAAYLAYLEGHSVDLEVIPEQDRRLDAVGRAATADAMARGAGAIVQAPLMSGRWGGYADVLLRVEESSDLGSWSYIAVDTKLALETRSGMLLQLCLYTDMLEELQGRLPDEMRVVSPGRYDEPECFRSGDFMAYYRRVRADLEEAVDAPETSVPPDSGALVLSTYPEPVPQCDVCKWWSRCNKQRHDDDHLSLVAGISRLQRQELTRRDIESLTALADEEMPLSPRPKQGAPESYERVHHQARIQRDSRGEEKPRIEILSVVEPETGLARLPEPSPGDLFFDFEGDPFVQGGGLEYLFGWMEFGEDDGEPGYHSLWSLDQAEEKRAFEMWIDHVMARLQEHPGLHIYHFAPYEPAALKRLMGRHATREAELDFLLRSDRFVDLHQVVRESMRIGVESYGLKHLEAVHGYERDLKLAEASMAMRAVERALELGRGASIMDNERERVALYNRDDCVSTLRLRDWLEAVRAEQLAAGAEIPRPPVRDGEVSDALEDALERRQVLAARLTEGLPEQVEDRTAEEQGQWLLAQLLEWHRREGKSSWWEYFRLADLAAEDLLYERQGLYGLKYEDDVPGGTAKCPIHRYRFAEQDFDIRDGDVLHVDQETTLGAVEAIDLDRRTIDVRKRQSARDEHPAAVFAHKIVNPKPLPDAIERLADWVLAHGIDAPGPYRAARDLLVRRAPRVGQAAGEPLRKHGEDSVEAAKRLALSLDTGVLPIQGPPGTGKTHAGARMICALVQNGQTVGITANSHKVIRNLIDDVLQAAAEEGMDVRCVKKKQAGEADLPATVIAAKGNKAFAGALRSGTANVGGATVWAWSRADFDEIIDTLVIDEAGQLSLANAVAAAQCARNVILLGDPQQLDQPIQGSHPEGSELSVLEHLLNGRDTIPEDRGLFLDETWRLHPAVCAFTSEIYYEGKLDAREGCEQQRITGPTSLAGGSKGGEGAGLWLAPCDHEGNQTSSAEEVERVARLVSEFTAPGVEWTDRDGVVRPVGLEEIVIVAPYNSQVAALRAGLPDRARVGTVDKFQGQEAPIVIYSMATSSAEEAPRGLEFLFSANRMNVATSRAKCACVVVASPKLFSVECRSPRQMKLVNGMCRYGEMAELLPA